MVDYIVFLCLIICFLFGYRDGWTRTILGPISLAIGVAACMIYYKKTGNMVVALTISTLGPIALKFIFNLILKFWVSIRKIKEDDMSSTSRLMGGLMNMIWSGAMLAIIIVLIVITPAPFDWLLRTQRELTASNSFKIINALAGGRIQARSADLNTTIEFFQDPEKIAELRSSIEFKNLLEDEKIKDIFSDEKTSQQIQEKNFTQLIANPKIRAILGDKELLKKIYEVNKKIIKEKMEETAQ